MTEIIKQVISMLIMCLKAFLIGGIICVIGQLLIDITKLTPARILVSFVCVGVLLGALGVYDRLADFAGAGATIPLTGFGSALARGVREAVDRDGFMGIFTGGFTAMAGGVTVAILSGLITALVTKSKDK
jgi:stage V sporulation protein AE